MKNPLDRIGLRGPIVMAISAIVIGLSLQPFIGTDGWAGLGQWVGGLGALVAAWVALDIAQKEAGRENRRERRHLHAHAHYIWAEWDGHVEGGDVRIAVKHEGTEPVRKVTLEAVCVDGFAMDGLDSVEEPQAVLLPTEHWRPSVRIQGSTSGPERLLQHLQGGAEIEIRFEDLDGTPWRRIGRRPPVIDEMPRP